MKKDIKLINLNRKTSSYNLFLNTKEARIEGRDKLVQEIIKKILTLRGSNKFQPNWGTDFFSLIGNTTGSQDSVRESLPVMIKNLETSIKEKQSLEDNLEDSERLLSLTLENMELDEQLLGWKIVLQVVTEDLAKYKFTVI